MSSEDGENPVQYTLVEEVTRAITQCTEYGL